MARKSMRMTGAEIRAAQVAATEGTGRWRSFETRPFGATSDEWHYFQVFLQDRDGLWWSAFLKKHRSDDRHLGQVFDVHPVVRVVAMVEKVTWVRER